MKKDHIYIICYNNNIKYAITLYPPANFAEKQISDELKNLNDQVVKAILEVRANKYKLIFTNLKRDKDRIIDKDSMTELNKSIHMKKFFRDK